MLPEQPRLDVDVVKKNGDHLACGYVTPKEQKAFREVLDNGFVT